MKVQCIAVNIMFLVIIFEHGTGSVLRPAGTRHKQVIHCYLKFYQVNEPTFETVEKFKYLGTTLTNHNSIPEVIKNRLRSGNAYYYPVQNLLSSRLLNKNLKIKIYRTIILPVVLYGCET